MEKFKNLIVGLREALKTVKNRANDVLGRLPPLEQFEKTSPVYAGIQSCGFAVDFLNHAVQDIARELDALDPEKAAKEAADDILKTRIDAGELIRKEDFEAKLTSGEFVKKADAEEAAKMAANNREKEVRDEIQKVELRRKEVSTARSETEPALIAPELAARLSGDVLKADNYVDMVKKVAARVEEMKKLGVQTPELLNSAAETPVDDAGDKVFKDRMSFFSDIAKKAGGGSGGVTAPEPLASGAGSGKEDLVGCF